MPFVLKKMNTYKWPVEHETPIDGGRYDKQTFDAEFRYLKNSEIKKLIEEKSNGELLDAVLVSVSGIKDESGADIPYSEDLRKQLLEVPGMITTLVSTFLGSLAREKAKN